MMTRYGKVLLLTVFLSGGHPMTYAAEHTVFSKLSETEMESLETDLAYFFGASDPKAVAGPYIQALKALEKLGIRAPESHLQAEMIPPLETAYRAVQEQTNLSFDVHKAAQLECQLILAQTREESFEILRDIMVNIYKTVFQSESEDIVKAAMLRTFLYHYKVRLLNSGLPLTPRDKDILMSIARESENLLTPLIKKQSLLEKEGKTRL